MSNWSQQDIHAHMHVYSSDGHDLGHVSEVYADSFLVHKGIFPTDRYFPYSTVASVQEDRVQLLLDVDEAKMVEWEKRPDYKEHAGDPTQLFYDRGHGIDDPFDETHPTG